MTSPEAWLKASDCRCRHDRIGRKSALLCSPPDVIKNASVCILLHCRTSFQDDHYALWIEKWSNGPHFAAVVFYCSSLELRIREKCKWHLIHENFSLKCSRDFSAGWMYLSLWCINRLQTVHVSSVQTSHMTHFFVLSQGISCFANRHNCVGIIYVK